MQFRHTDVWRDRQICSQSARHRCKWLPATEHARQVTEDLVSRILGRKSPDGLDAELARVCGEVRRTYAKVLASSYCSPIAYLMPITNLWGILRCHPSPVLNRTEYSANL